MFQVLALTGLYLPPRAQMTQADWKDVHCHGDSECHVMKTKALAPELQVIFSNANACGATRYSASVTRYSASNALRRVTARPTRCNALQRVQQAATLQRVTARPTRCNALHLS